MRIWWIGAALLWAATSIGVAVHRNADEAAGYAAGAAVGRLLGSLAIALLVSWIANAVRGGGHRVWHPWTLVLAAAISLATLLWMDETNEISCTDAPRLEAAELVSDPPEGYEVTAIPDAEARELLDQFPADARDDIGTINGVVAAKGGEGVAVYAITSAGRRIDAEEELEAFQKGSDEPTEELKVGEEDGLLVTVDDGTLVMSAVGDCGLVLLVSPDEEPAREMAGALTPPKD